MINKHLTTRAGALDKLKQKSNDRRKPNVQMDDAEQPRLGGVVP